MELYHNVVFGFTALLLSACAISPLQTVPTNSKIGDTNMPKDRLEQFALLAMMSSNAYHDPEKGHFAVDKLGWNLIDLKGEVIKNPTYTNHTGLAGDVYRNQEGKCIVVFRGSDSRLDWILTNFSIYSFQYKSAQKEFDGFNKKYKQCISMLTGHSLGGGLALSISGQEGKPAIVFDSSPRVFDGWGTKPLPAPREGLYQLGEFASKVRRHWPKYYEYVDPKNEYYVNYDFGGKNLHSGATLALKLLEDASKANPVYLDILTDYQAKTPSK